MVADSDSEVPSPDLWDGPGHSVTVLEVSSVRSICTIAPLTPRPINGSLKYDLLNKLSLRLNTKSTQSLGA